MQWSHDYIRHLFLLLKGVLIESLRAGLPFRDWSGIIPTNPQLPALRSHSLIFVVMTGADIAVIVQISRLPAMKKSSRPLLKI